MASSDASLACRVSPAVAVLRRPSQGSRGEGSPWGSVPFSPSGTSLFLAGPRPFITQCRWPGVWSRDSQAPARMRPHPSLVSSRMSLPISWPLSWIFGHLFSISWCGPCPPWMMLPQALLSLCVSTLGFLFGSVPATASFMVASLEPAALEMEQMKLLRETLGK